MNEKARFIHYDSTLARRPGVKGKRYKQMKKLGFLLILAVFVVALALQAIPTQAYGVTGYSKIYEGIEYATGYATSPRLMRAWAVRVNLKNPDVGIFATPGNGGAPYDTTLDGTDHFLGFYGCKVATNACHWDINTPAPYADVLGLLISMGGLVSNAGGIWPGQLNFTSVKDAWFISSNDNPVGVSFGVETGPYILINGVVQPYAPAINPYTGYGITQDGKRLIMVCVDGRQPGWSDGCTYAELGQWLKDFGAWNGVHMDGGGSTCMVRADVGVVNRPSDGHVRQVAVSLGVTSAPGNRTGPNSCSMNANRVDIAYRGNLSQNYVRTWTSTGGWATPVNLGGLTYDTPAICSRYDGCLDYVERAADNQIYIKNWTTATGWSDWTCLSGSIIAGPAICRRDNNNMELIALAVDNAMWRRSWNNGTGWTAWTSLGGSCMYNPAVVVRADGSLNVFVTGTDRALYQKILPLGGSWTGWLQLPLSGSYPVDGGPSVCARDATHMDVFVRGSDFAIKHITYTNGTGWGAWESFTGTNAPSVTACSTNSTTIKTFHRGLSDELWERDWTSASGWGAFTNQGNCYY